MQCPSCQFENMPGVAACGRCGAQLRLSNAAIDICPPRASVAAKRWRRWFPIQRLGFLLRNAFGRFFSEISLEFALDFDRSTAGAFLRMIVPGWPQVYLGCRRRGQIMLALYLALLLLGLLSVGIELGNVLLGAALAVHASSILDVVWSAAHDLRTRCVTAAICVVVVAVVVYYPLVRTVTRFVAVRRMNMTAGAFLAGDVIVYRPNAYSHRAPSVGEVVLYEVPRRDVQGVTPAGGNAVYRIGGEFIDRILAEPGQSIQWKPPRLVVDGRPSDQLPLHPEQIPANLQFTIPAGYYGILPSAQPGVAPGFPMGVWQEISLVPRQSIRGPVVLRHRPLWRWGRIQ